jgi:membrane-associated phospholipid phosphatase
MKKTALVSLILLLYSFVYAQNPQTATQSVNTDSFPRNYSHEIIARPVFNWRSIAIPGSMITYGAIALKCDWFQDWNEAIKNELWTESPHHQVHIDNYLQWAPAASAIALGITGVKGRHNFTDRVFILGMAELIQSSAVASIKKFSGETRPNGEGDESFPSGHTSNAFTGAEFMRLEYKDVSPWYGVYGYLLAASTGFLRMYNNKHWLSDVLAGAGTGILSTDLAYYLYPKIKQLFHLKRSSHTIIFPTYNNGAPGVALQVGL